MAHILFNGDCFDILPTLDAQSIDLLLTDPPYAQLAHKWDQAFDLAKWWAEIKRVMKPGGTCVVFGAQPFTSKLICSNEKAFRFQWIWDKGVAANFMNAKVAPMKLHEEVSVFCWDGKPKYNPQMVKLDKPLVIPPRKANTANNLNNIIKTSPGYHAEEINPKSIIKFNPRDKDRFHPTQKPIALLEYLIRTHSDESATVLDCFMGSGSTGIACHNTGRKFVGIERNEAYFEKASAWIASHSANGNKEDPGGQT